LFASCRLSIAPLRYGGGVKGKIVSSLSYGVPVVATSIAAEGMGLRHDHDVLIGDEPDTMADAIVRLYGDPALWRRLSRNGYETFVRTFSERASAKKIVRVFDDLVAAARATR
jgi:glycosyltransferase involved in cell wall biosynthesis